MNGPVILNSYFTIYAFSGFSSFLADDFVVRIFLCKVLNEFAVYEFS